MIISDVQSGSIVIC